MFPRPQQYAAWHRVTFIKIVGCANSIEGKVASGNGVHFRSVREYLHAAKVFRKCTLTGRIRGEFSLHQLNLAGGDGGFRRGACQILKSRGSDKSDFAFCD
jgi:hypothetical protein